MQQQQQFWIPHNVGNYSFINEVEENKWNAINQQTKNEVFVQIVSKKDYPSKDSFYKLTRYIELTKKLQSQFFSQCLDFFEDKRFFYVVFDKPEGITLKEYVSKNCGKITEEFVKTFFTSLISAFQELDNNQFSITYNNIYVNNFDLHDNNSYKIQLTIIPYMMNYVVNPNYIFEAPEVFLGKSKNSISNVWTCGVLLYFISTGTLPFSIAPFNSSEFQKIILNDPIQIPLYLPSNVKDLLNKMFVKNSYTRIKFEQLFDHSWINKESVNQASKSYSRINTEQFPSLWSQPNVINISAKNDDFMKAHHVHVQIHSKKRPSRFHIERIKKINIC